MDLDMDRLGRRRVLLGSAAATLGCGASFGALGRGYPSRLITFVVPFTPGAAPDAFVRAIAREVARDAGVTAIVENKPGAGSVLAAQLVAKAAPDGHTVLVTGNVAITGNPHVFKKLPYDPVADFTPVTPLSRGPMVLYVNPLKLPVSSVPDMVQVLRKAPGAHSFGFTSITSRLPAEVLQQTLGLNLVGVPYRSGNSALPDLVSGQIDMMFTDFSAWPHVASGKLRALAVTNRQRSPFAPELPSFDELGIKGIDIGFWIAAYLPTKASPEVVTRLHQLLSRATHAADVKNAYRTSGTVEFLLPEGDLVRFQAQESSEWGRIIRAAGIKPE